MTGPPPPFLSYNENFGLGCMIKANCPLVGPKLVGGSSLVVGFKADCLSGYLGLWVGCPPSEVFLRVPTPYLRKFRRKTRKTPNGWIDKRDGE